jgi:hypothetical protein
MLFQSSDIDPPMGFSVPGNVAGSCATIVFDLAEFFGALGTHAAPDFGNPHQHWCCGTALIRRAEFII